MMGNNSVMHICIGFFCFPLYSTWSFILGTCFPDKLPAHESLLQILHLRGIQAKQCTFQNAMIPRLSAPPQNLPRTPQWSCVNGKALPVPDKGLKNLFPFWLSGTIFLTFPLPTSTSLALLEVSFPLWNFFLLGTIRRWSVLELFLDCSSSRWFQLIPHL